MLTKSSCLTLHSCFKFVCIIYHFKYLALVETKIYINRKNDASHPRSRPLLVLFEALCTLHIFRYYILGFSDSHCLWASLSTRTDHLDSWYFLRACKSIRDYTPRPSIIWDPLVPQSCLPPPSPPPLTNLRIINFREAIISFTRANVASVRPSSTKSFNASTPG